MRWGRRPILEHGKDRDAPQEEYGEKRAADDDQPFRINPDQRAAPKYQKLHDFVDLTDKYYDEKPQMDIPGLNQQELEMVQGAARTAEQKNKKHCGAVGVGDWDLGESPQTE